MFPPFWYIVCWSCRTWCATRGLNNLLYSGTHGVEPVICPLIYICNSTSVRATQHTIRPIVGLSWRPMTVTWYFYISCWIIPSSLSAWLSAKTPPSFFVSGCVSLNNDYFRNLCMNNVPVAQFQTASLAEELLSLREGFVTLYCGTFSRTMTLMFCWVLFYTEWWRQVAWTGQLFLLYFSCTCVRSINCTFLLTCGNLGCCLLMYWGTNKMIIIK